MIADRTVVALSEPFESRGIDSIATVLMSFDDSDAYEVEWGDMSGKTSAVPASKLRVVSQDELDSYIHIDDPETLDVIRRLMTRLGMSPIEVVRYALQTQLGCGNGPASNDPTN